MPVLGPLEHTNTRQLARRLIVQFDLEHPDVKRHCERVATLAARLAQNLGLEEAAVREAEIAGALHDIGKINLTNELLHKPALLDPLEIRAIQEVPLHSASIARLLGFSNEIQRAISQRHERPDGRGYPYGIGHDSISLLARVVAICDTFDSLTHDQPYRRACSAIEAIGIIRSKCVTHFDATMVDAFTTLTLPPVTGTA